MAFEDREKLPHHGNEGDLLGSAMGSELVVEGPEKGTGRVAVRAATYSTARTDVRPLAMALRPRIRPESGLIGATPTRAATLHTPRSDRRVSRRGASPLAVGALSSKTRFTLFMRHHDAKAAKLFERRLGQARAATVSSAG